MRTSFESATGSWYWLMPLLPLVLACGRGEGWQYPRDAGVSPDSGVETDGGTLGPGCRLSADWEPTTGFVLEAADAGHGGAGEWRFASDPFLSGCVEYRVKASYRREVVDRPLNVGVLDWFISACNRCKEPVFTRWPTPFRSLSVMPGNVVPGLECFDEVIGSSAQLTAEIQDTAGAAVPLNCAYPFDVSCTCDPARPIYYQSYRLDPSRSVAVREDMTKTGFPKGRPIFYDFRNDYNAVVGRPLVVPFQYRSDLNMAFQLLRFDFDPETIPYHDGMTVACNAAGFPVSSECGAINPADRARDEIPSLVVRGLKLPPPLFDDLLEASGQ